MSQSNGKDGEGSLNEEFNFYLQFTKPLVLDLPTPEDRAVAAAWVQKLEAEPETEEEKRLRLDYLKLLLFVLQRGRLSGIFKKQPESGPLQPFPQGFTIIDMGNLMIDRDEIQAAGGGDSHSVPYTIEISSDLREFVAAQEVPNFGVQMYYAWSSDDPIHKWSLFDEDKFPSYILEKIKQLKEESTDDKTGKPKKPCDLSLTKNYSKTKVKSPEEIEKTQGRSYHTYVGLVGRMGGFKDSCDDDQDKNPRNEQRKSRCPKKCEVSPARMCPEQEEEYEEFLNGLSGPNSSRRKTCMCPHTHHRSDCEAHGKGVQPFEERNPRSVSPIPKAENWGSNWPSGVEGNRGLNAPMNQCRGEYSNLGSSQQRSGPPRRVPSPLRNNEMPTTGGASKECSRAQAYSSYPQQSSCLCPCPRSPPQDVPRAAPPSPSVLPQESGGRSCADRYRRLQRPINLMLPQDSVGRSGGSSIENSAPSREPAHCYDQQFQNQNQPPVLKMNDETWTAVNDFNRNAQPEDTRKQKIAKLSKISGKEATDELEGGFAYQCTGTHSTPSNRQQNFEYPPNCSGAGGLLAPPPTNNCYSPEFKQATPPENNFPQGPYAEPNEYKGRPNTETSVKSLGFSPASQGQFEERPPCPHMRSGGAGSEGGRDSMLQKSDQSNKCKNQSMNYPKSQNDNSQSGRFQGPPPSNNSGRLCDMANVLEGIKMKTEAHREKCNQSGSRRPPSRDPNPCQKSGHSRTPSPFQGHPSYQSPQTQNKYQSQSSSGKPCPEAMAEGMMSNQYANANTTPPDVWASPSTYCPSQSRQQMTYDTYGSSKVQEGANSAGKRICNAGATPHPRSSGEYRSSKSYPEASAQNFQAHQRQSFQGPPPQTSQRPATHTCQGPPPQISQRPAPHICQGSQPQASQRLAMQTYNVHPPPTCQPEDDDPCDDENDDDRDSCPGSLDECPQGSSTSAEFLDGVPCEEIPPTPQQWPGPLARRNYATPENQKESRPNIQGQEQGRKRRGMGRGMVCSTPIHAPFLADESTIPCSSPPPVCDESYQYEPNCETYTIPQQGQNPQIQSSEPQFYQIFGKSGSQCQHGGQPAQGYGGFMEMQNESQRTCNSTTTRRRNMLAAPMPDEQFFGEDMNQYNSCHGSNFR